MQKIPQKLIAKDFPPVVNNIRNRLVLISFIGLILIFGKEKIKMSLPILQIELSYPLIRLFLQLLLPFYLMLFIFRAIEHLIYLKSESPTILSKQKVGHDFRDSNNWKGYFLNIQRARLIVVETLFPILLALYVYACLV